LKLQFSKYHSNGNDFILIDNRKKLLNPDNQRLIAQLCDRRFGIGADGLILLDYPTDNQYSFKMIYFNSDGKEGSFCGNGARAIIHFAQTLAVIENKTTFQACDGVHFGELLADKKISVSMNIKADIQQINNKIFTINTGSPHYVAILDENIDDFDLLSFAKNIRYSTEYKQVGINVNVVNIDKEIKMRTYERGVEAETLSCGTGAVAVGLIANAYFATTYPVKIKVLGGWLEIDKNKENHTIFLRGETAKVYSGDVEIRK